MSAAIGSSELESQHDDDLSIAEREIRVKERELELKVIERKASRWRSPLLVAVLAAGLGAFGSAYIAFYNAREARDAARVEFEQNLALARTSAENARILEMIKLGEPVQVRENLLFLIEAQLVVDPNTVTSIREYYSKTDPGIGPGTSPFLSRDLSGQSGVFGLDESVVVDQLPEDHRAKIYGKSVGIVSVWDKESGALKTCGGFVVAEAEILTSSSCLQNAGRAVFRLAGGPAVELILNGTDADGKIANTRPSDLYWGYTSLKSADGVTLGKPLSVKQFDLSVGQKLGIIYFRNNSLEQLVVWGSEDCKVLSVEVSTFNHLCDTGRGTSGSPIFDLRTGAVIGVHDLRGLNGGVAHRIGTNE